MRLNVILCVVPDNEIQTDHLESLVEANYLEYLVPQIGKQISLKKKVTEYLARTKPNKVDDAMVIKVCIIDIFTLFLVRIIIS